MRNEGRGCMGDPQCGGVLAQVRAQYSLSILPISVPAARSTVLEIQVLRVLYLPDVLAFNGHVTFTTGRTPTLDLMCASYECKS